MCPNGNVFGGFPRSLRYNFKQFSTLIFPIFLISTDETILKCHLNLLGLVRSNPVLTAVQITSRSAVLWSVVHHVEVVQVSIKRKSSCRYFLMIDNMISYSDHQKMFINLLPDICWPSSDVVRLDVDRDHPLLVLHPQPDEHQRRNHHLASLHSLYRSLSHRSHRRATLLLLCFAQVRMAAHLP